MNRRLSLPAALAVAVCLTAVACTGHGRTAIIKPAPPLPATSSTTGVVDLSDVELGGVPGRTTSTVVMGPGRAALNGTVSGPQGLIGGATIRVERLVGDGIASVTLPSNPDGTFTVPNILGGRYRVRAYVPAPYNLAQVDPQVFFLGGNENKALNLQMTLYNGLAVASSMAPDPPFVNDPTNLVVQVTTQSVDAQGVVRGTPVPSAKVQLFGTSVWRVETANPTITDARGQAQFRVRCGAPGQQPLSVVVADTASSQLDVAPCVQPPPPPSTVPPSTTSTAPTRPTVPVGSTTTSSSSTTEPSTTSTTRKA